MSRDQQLDTRPITDFDQLLEHFRIGEKPRERRLVGTEHEKFVFRRADAGMLSYDEPGGFGDLFAELASRFGWEPDYDGDNIVALERDGSAITLEPGGQFELSGGVKRTVFETRDELDNHLDEIRQIGGDRLAYTVWGLNPFYTPDEVPWMPKARYAVMRKYMPTRGDHALWMMKTTCTIQANFDYTDEADAADIMRTGVLVSPAISALFASSPIRKNNTTGMQSYRGHIWTRTDPDRTGVPAFMYRDDWGYRDYLEYVLDVPMFFIRREEGYIDLAGHSFRDFLKNGIGPHRATMGDFELHLSTLFPEVRLKQYIEVRGADGGPREFVLALPALWKGLLYDEPTRRAAAGLFSSLEPAAHAELYTAAYRDGIHAHTALGPMRELASELVELAARGLTAQAKEGGHADEGEFLTPLRELLASGKSLADRLDSDFQQTGSDKLALIDRWLV